MPSLSIVSILAIAAALLPCVRPSLLFSPPTLVAFSSANASAARSPAVPDKFYALAAAAAAGSPPLLFGVHTGQWRDVRRQLCFSAAADEGRHITVYCNSSAGAAGEGKPCAHAGGVLRCSHWSCCGAQDRGAAACRV